MIILKMINFKFYQIQRAILQKLKSRRLLTPNLGSYNVGYSLNNLSKNFEMIPFRQHPFATLTLLNHL